jgi:hypothetical protein
MKRLLVLLPLLAACGAAPPKSASAPSPASASGGSREPSDDVPAPAPPPPAAQESPVTAQPTTPPGAFRSGGGAPKGSVGGAEASSSGSTLDQARPGDTGRTAKPSDSQGGHASDGDHGQHSNETAGGKTGAGLSIRTVPLAGQLNKQSFQAATALVTGASGRPLIEIFDQPRSCDDKASLPNRLSIRLPSWVPSVVHEVPAAQAFFVVGGKPQPTRRALFELPSAPNAGERGKLRLLLTSASAGNEVEGEIEFLRCD